MTAKVFGDVCVYWPLPSYTGAQHAQSTGDAVRLEACIDFTADHEVHVDCRGALDAPDTIPRGGVRAQDWEPTKQPALGGRLLIAHEWRAGTHS